MNEFFTNFHFLRPLWLLLLAVPLLGYKYLFASLSSSSSWEGVCDKHLLEFLLVKGSSRQRSLLAYLITVGTVGAILSLAGPTWEKKDVPTFVPENPMMILLNLSTDMDVADITPSRLARAKYSIDDLLKLLPTTQTGLIVYSNEPYLISPVTQDHKILSNLLLAVDGKIMPDNGDKLGRAIDLAMEKMQYKKGNIVVFSADVGQDFNAALMAATEALAKGCKVSVFELNSQNSDKLKLLAQKGGGEYVQVAKNSASVTKLANFIMNEQNMELKKSKNSQEQWLDFGYYLLIFPLICCAYFFRRGILAASVVLLFTTQANAGFFSNANQEAMRAFNSGDYAQAAAKFEKVDWKASSLYKAGSYEDAYTHFAKNSDVESVYNQGNALAKAGKTEEAIAKYEEVLALKPEHEDAKFNLEYLKQHQQQNPEQKEDQKDEKEEKQNSQNNEQQQDKQNSEDKDSQKDQQQDKQNSKDKDSQKDEKQGKDKKNDKGAQSKPDNSNQQPPEQDAQSQVKDEEKKESSQQQQAMAAQQEQDKPYDEQMQALEQQYRDIPEDAGGLLRAFIRKDYIKNRYKENRR